MNRRTEPQAAPSPIPSPAQARQSDEILTLLDAWMRDDEQDQRETLEVLQQVTPITIERESK